MLLRQEDRIVGRFCRHQWRGQVLRTHVETLSRSRAAFPGGSARDRGEGDDFPKQSTREVANLRLKNSSWSRCPTKQISLLPQPSSLHLVAVSLFVSCQPICFGFGFEALGFKFRISCSCFVFRMPWNVFRVLGFTFGFWLLIKA